MWLSPPSHAAWPSAIKLATLLFIDSSQGPQLQLPSVKRLLLGGGELHFSMHAPLWKLLPAAQVWVAYGMTECASSITAGPLPQVPDAPGNGLAGGSYVGRPPPGIEIATRPSLQSSDNIASGTGSAGASQSPAAAGEETYSMSCQVHAARQKKTHIPNDQRRMWG